MRRLTYKSGNDSWNKDETNNFERQRRNDLNQDRSKVWVKKNIFLNLNEVDQCTNEYGCLMANHTLSLLKTLSLP